MIAWLNRFSEKGREFCLVERASKSFFESIVPLFPLHRKSLIEQIPVAQILQDELEQIDMFQPESWFLFRNMIEKKTNVLSDLQFVFRGIVKDVERNLVSEAFAAEKVIGSDAGKDLV